MLTTITDSYGDTLTVTAYHPEMVYLDAEEGDEATEIALDVKAAKQLRRTLKQFIKGEV